MVYLASRTDLKNIVQWLRGRTESQWEDQTSLLSDSMAELSDMAVSMARREKPRGGSDEPDRIPLIVAGIHAATPVLQEMLSAMQRRNREAALENGEAALELLP
jgi:hypothetical protein